MPISPVGHLHEEEMRWEASSKPGETAQEGEPWQAGDGAPSRGFGYRNEPACGQEQDDHYDSKKGDKDRGRERRRQEWEETGEHVCGEVEESAGRCWRAPALTSYTHKKNLGEVAVCVCGSCFCYLRMTVNVCVRSLAGVYVGSTTLMLSSCISGSHSNLKGEYDLVSGFHPSQFVLFHHRMKLQGDIRIYLLDSCKSMDHMPDAPQWICERFKALINVLTSCYCY